MTDHDPVTRPAHYRWLPGDLEVIDLTEGLSFCHGNVVKYVLRADHKGSALEDLKKAQWYLAREIARREGREVDATLDALGPAPTAPVVDLDSATKVRDRDGDEWERLDDGKWRATTTALRGLVRPSIEALSISYGPLTVVE